MPNWCSNTLNVSCAPGNAGTHELEKFVEHARQGDCEFSLNVLYPCPEPAREDNWGTKCDVKSRCEEIELDQGYVNYLFLSAWSPPLAWLEKVSADYPLLHFELHYHEPSMRISGVGVCHAGILVDNCIEY